MTSNKTAFSKVCIIGLGLMGGSFAAALKKNKLVRQISGYDTHTTSLDQATELDLIDMAAGSIKEAIQGAELIVIAVPVLEFEGVLQTLKEGLDGTSDDSPVITDMSSVKSIVIEAATRVFGQVPARLVPGHPIAGSEKHGVKSANPELFRDHKVILTPVKDTSASATKAVRSLWESLGSEVVQMDALHHDQVLAQTSHLPHLLAYALVDTLCNQPDGKEIFKYAAGGFRDFSRIAASDPTMWRDIFKANRDAVLEILDKFTHDLSHIRDLIEKDELEALSEKFAKAKEARDYFSSIDKKDGD